MKSLIFKKHILYTALAVVILITSFVGGGARFARAAATTSAVEDFETQNVWEDLQGATIDGEGIDLTLYNFDEHKNVQLISFVEFCYSFRSDKQSDYGLYVYVYNPRGYDWTQNEVLNKIQFRTGGEFSDLYGKYDLKYLNRSEQTGYEGLFYKFKIILSDRQRKDILSSLNSSERIYEVGEIELFHAGWNATAYDVSNKYIYSGFAEGYGNDSEHNETLRCESDLIITVSPEVHHTSWRPVGDNGKFDTSFNKNIHLYAQDSIHSVYFAVPNKIAQNYDYLDSVRAKWLEAITAPALVTGNEEVYSALINYVGSKIRYIGDKIGYGFDGYWKGVSSYAYRGMEQLNYNLDKFYGDYYNGDLYTITKNGGLVLNYLPYLFYAENVNASDYVVSSEKILKWICEDYEKQSGIMRDYTISSNGYEINNSFADKIEGVIFKRLFESVAEDFVTMNITRDTVYPITEQKWGQNWSEKWFGNKLHLVSSITKEIEAIHEVTANDFKVNDKDKICNLLYICENDYEEFKNFYDRNRENNTVYLLRFAQSEYISSEITEYRTNDNAVTSSDAYKEIDKNAYMFQDSAYLFFDIIDLTYDKSGVKTVIPVVMSPIHIVSPGTPPPIPKLSISDWWKYALTATVVLVAVTIGATFVEKRTKKMHEEER